MAQPIPLDLPPRDDREQFESRLHNAPAEHARALLAGYEVLQSLYERGALDWLQAAIGSADKMLAAATDAATKPDAIRALRNLVILGKLLGAIDPETLSRCSESLTETLAAVRTPAARPPSFWALLGELRQPDFRRGIHVVSQFIGVLGRRIGS